MADVMICLHEGLRLPPGAFCRWRMSCPTPCMDDAFRKRLLSGCAACGLATRFPVDDPLEEFTPKTLSLAKGFRLGRNRVRRGGKKAVLMADHWQCSNVLGGDRPSPHRLVSPQDRVALQEQFLVCRERHNRQDLPGMPAQCRWGTMPGAVEGTTEKPAARRLS